MSIYKIIKQQIILFSLIIVVAILSAVSLSYAVFMNINSNTDNQVIQTANLDISYGETGSSISGDILPMDDALGQTQAGYTINLTNNIEYPIAYTITLYNNPPSGFSGELVDYQYIKVSIDGSTPVAISSLTNQNGGLTQATTIYQLYSSTIPAGNTPKNHTIRVWLDEDTSITEVGKYIYLQMKVTSEISE